MTEEYTKDKLIEEFITANGQMLQYMANIDNTMKAINDSNLLHSNTIEQNTIIIREMVAGNNAILKFFHILFMLFVITVLALIVLAGAEKIIPLVPTLLGIK